jgi:hypothetical protein
MPPPTRREHDHHRAPEEPPHRVGERTSKSRETARANPAGIYHDRRRHVGMRVQELVASPYGQFAWFDPLLAGASSILVLLIVGLIWAIRTLHVVGQDRRWSWWIAPAPVVVGLAAAVLVLLPPDNMLDHRDEFEAVARELSAQPSNSREHIEIGPFDISSARATSGGEVYFAEDSGFSLMSASGWAYAPGGPPAGFDDFTATHLDGPWYEFSAIWRD